MQHPTKTHTALIIIVLQCILATAGLTGISVPASAQPAQAQQAQHPLLLRQPAISPDGSLVAFSFQGDIWTVSAAGGNATRLTIHDGYESHPVFSPDGKQIAFSGARFGNNDLFVIPTQGGAVRRLTFHSGEDIISSWSGNEIL